MGSAQKHDANGLGKARNASLCCSLGKSCLATKNDQRGRSVLMNPCFESFDTSSVLGASRARSSFRQMDFGHRQIEAAGSFQMGDGRGLP